MRDEAPGVAIVGMAALFPGAPDLDAYRANLLAGQVSITEVPPDRWDPVFYDPASTALDRFYGRTGGFVDPWAWFDPLAHGVVPTTVAQAEPDQLVLLQLATDALRDAGLTAADLPRESTGVFIGRGGYITPGLARSAQKVREGEQVLATLRQVLPHLSEADLGRVKAAFTDAAGDLAPDQAIGLVPNLAASRTANRLDLHGPACTFDAACASALLAVDHAATALRLGRIDAALVGGVHLCHDPTFWSIFCRLGAMSRQGVMRPFDRRADGLLVGEGAGMVLLKRAADALADGDRIYAVIRGSGVASDGRGATLMSPSSAGQALAVRRAWTDAGLDPATVGFVEAHGTGTHAGDAAELATLAEVFGPAGDGPSACVGSVKALIGHTMPAAGIAGLIKAALAVHEGTWLPMPGPVEPHEGLARTRFTVVEQATAWPDGPTPRRAGVNAFGFGGIDAHVVLEQAPAPTASGRTWPRHPAVALYSAADPATLAAAVLDDHRGLDGGPCRCALRDPTPERRARAATIVRSGRPWHGRRGIWFAPTGLARTGRIALLFPGVEEAFDARVAEVADALGLDLPSVLHQPPAPLSDLGLRSAQIVGTGRVLVAALRRLRVAPHLLTGHSIGEWTALIAGGVVPDGFVDGFVDSLADETLAVPDVVFGVIGTDRPSVDPLLADVPDVVVSHDNCPHQTIVCGPEASVRTVLGRTRALSEVLPFKSGFHTPHFQPFVDRFAPHIDAMPLTPGTLPVWSACTGAPYPTDADAVRDVLRRHLVDEVGFRGLVERLHDEGVRVFVQVGAGSLTGFVDDTLKGRDHVAVSTHDARLSPLHQLTFAAAALWCEGVDIDVRALPGLRAPRGTKLQLGAPLVTLAAPPTLVAATPAPSRGTLAQALPDLPPGRVGQAAQASLDAILDARRDVLSALSTAPVARPIRAARAAPAPLGPRSRTTTRALSVASDPYLLDHCMFHQPDDVADASVRYPVVPMTMNLQLMMDAAAELVPERVVIGMEQIRAWRWLVVAPPVEITIEARFDGEDRVAVSIPGYAEATVLLGHAYPPAPATVPLELADEQPLSVPVDRIYPDRWMFHGPTYQGIVDLGPTGSNGIRGAITAPSAPGALLDNAGQVFGFWGFERLATDGLGFPARIASLRFYGPMPALGTRFDVSAWVDEVTDAAMRGRIELSSGGRVWCQLDGWQNRRFETDAKVMPFLRLSGTHSLADVQPDGSVRVVERWRTTASRELLIRRYLDPAHLTLYEAVPPWEQRAWVLRRIAACDAVREWLWARGHGPVFPIHVQLDDAPDGGLIVRGPVPPGLQVAVVLGDRVAAAAVAVDAIPTPCLDSPPVSGRTAGGADVGA